MITFMEYNLNSDIYVCSVVVLYAPKERDVHVFYELDCPSVSLLVHLNGPSFQGLMLLTGTSLISFIF